MSPWKTLDNSYFWISSNFAAKNFIMRFLWKGRIYEWGISVNKREIDLEDEVMEVRK